MKEYQFEWVVENTYCTAIKANSRKGALNLFNNRADNIDDLQDSDLLTILLDGKELFSADLEVNEDASGKAKTI